MKGVRQCFIQRAFQEYFGHPGPPKDSLESWIATYFSIAYLTPLSSLPWLKLWNLVFVCGVGRGGGISAEEECSKDSE